MTDSLGLFVQSQRITMEQISELRQDLEGLVSRRAALAAGSKKMAEVNRLLKKAAALAKEGPAKWDELMQADKEIHLALARLAGNPLHRFFLETVHNNFHRYHINTYLPRDEETIRTTLEELKAIVQAVSQGDAGQAEALSKDHVERATEAMKRQRVASEASNLKRTEEDIHVNHQPSDRKAGSGIGRSRSRRP